MVRLCLIPVFFAATGCFAATLQPDILSICPREFYHNGEVFRYYDSKITITDRAGSAQLWYSHRVKMSYSAPFDKREEVLRVSWKIDPDDPRYTRSHWVGSKKSAQRNQTPGVLYSSTKMVSVYIRRQFNDSPQILGLGYDIIRLLEPHAFPIYEEWKPPEFQVRFDWDKFDPFVLKYTLQQKTAQGWGKPDANVSVKLFMSPMNERLGNLEGFGDLINVFEVSPVRRPPSFRLLLNRVIADTNNDQIEPFASGTVDLRFGKDPHKLENNLLNRVVVAAFAGEYSMNPEFLSTDLRHLNRRRLSERPLGLAAEVRAEVWGHDNTGDERLFLESAPFPVYVDHWARIVGGSDTSAQSNIVTVSRERGVVKVYKPGDIKDRLPEDEFFLLVPSDRIHLGRTSSINIKFLWDRETWEITGSRESLTENERATISIGYFPDNGDNYVFSSGIWLISGGIAVALDTYATGGLGGSAVKFVVGWAIDKAINAAIDWGWPKKVGWVNITPHGTKIGIDVDDSGLRAVLLQGSASFTSHTGKEVTLGLHEQSTIADSGDISDVQPFDPATFSQTLRSLIAEDGPEIASDRSRHSRPEPVQPGGNDLFSVVSTGDTALVFRLLEQGADVNAADASGHSALYYAVILGELPIATLLLESGANPDATDAYMNVPLHSAITQGDVPMMKRLISHHADVNHKGERGETLLNWACATGNRDVVRTLIEAGADLDAYGELDRTALSIACESDFLDIVKDLVRGGASVDKPINLNGSDPHAGNTPLMLATAMGYEEIVEVLLAAGADPDYRAPNGETARSVSSTDAITQKLNAGSVRRENLPQARRREYEGFALSVPADMVPRDAVDNASVASFHVLDEYGQLEVLVYLRVEAQGGNSLETFRNNHVNELARKFEQFRLLGCTNGEIDGKPSTAFRYDYDWKGKVVNGWVHLVLHEGKIWQLNLVGSGAAFEDRRSEFAAIAKSMQIGN